MNRFGIGIVRDVQLACNAPILDDLDEQLDTIAELYEVLTEQTRDGRARPGDDVPARTDLCLTATTFYLVRAEICRRFGLPRWQVRPRDRLEELLPAADRRSAWTGLARALELQLPALVLPRWLQVASIGSILGSLLAGWWAGIDLPLVVLLVIVALRWSVSRWLMRPLANRFDPALATVGDLCSALLAGNYRQLVKRLAPPGSNDVFQRVKVIMVEQTGLHPAVVTRDASLVHDLGMD